MIQYIGEFGIGSFLEPVGQLFQPFSSRFGRMKPDPFCNCLPNQPVGQIDCKHRVLL